MRTRILIGGVAAVAMATIAVMAARGTAPTAAAAVVTGPRAPTGAGVVAVAPSSDDVGARQGRRRHRRDSLVWLDGRVVGALRASELAPGLAPHPHFPEAGAERYTMRAYLESIGIDLARVKQVQFHGGSVGVMDGKELRRIGDRMMISFWGGDRSRARLHWPEEAVKVSSTMDGVQSIALYADKAAPRVTPTGALAYADGSAVEGMAYATPGADKGTRVYVDGRLRATINKQSRGASGVGGSLGDVLAASAVDLTGATVDLVEGDRLVTRATAAAKDLVVSVPGGTGGVLVLSDADGNKSRVTSVQLFVRGAPPAREAEGSAGPDDDSDEG